MKLFQFPLAFSAIFCTFIVHAVPVDVSWSDPHKFRDLSSVTEKKSSFQHRFFKEINKHLNELSTRLPHGYKLSIDVTQVDLAGRIDFVHGQRIRVIKDMYYPNMAFTYRLHDNSGKLMLSSSEQIKGKAFLANATPRSSVFDSFPYEKRMLTNWYKKEFAAILKESSQNKDSFNAH